MPVYNGETYVRETIDSVLRQSFTNFEFIIVNDGSTDSTLQILESYDDKRIILVNLEQNRGVSNARNVGTDSAIGDYIAFCDADDLYDPNRLKAQLDYLIQNPAVDVCGSYFAVFEGSHEVLVKHPLDDKVIKEHFFTSNCLAQPSIMGKANIFRDYKYNPDLQASEDYDLWTRMAIGGVVFGNVPYQLVNYRLHPTQASKTKSKLLYATSNAVCTDYTLAYLNNEKITRYSKSAELSLADFKEFLSELFASSIKKSRDINMFRPLIALQYRKLKTHRINAYMTLKMLASKYHLEFPPKYLLNIFLLSILPVSRKTKFFDTLTKLKL